jgi:uncharacterized protein (TIGR02996 family)
MNEELAFLTAIRDRPNDEATRLIYADWLEERGDPRGEFIRVECELATLSVRNERYNKLKERAKELAKKIDTLWLSIVSRPAIERCGALYRFVCPKKWEDLTPTRKADVRFCESCERNVFFCSSIRKAQNRARSGHCVAMDLRVERKHRDLEEPRFRTLGKMYPAHAERRAREERSEGQPQGRREGRKRGRRRR